MSDPTKLSVNIKSFDEKSCIVIATCTVEGYPESKPLVYQVHNFANTDVDNIIKNIAMSQYQVVMNEAKKQKVASNTEIISAFKQSVGKSISFNTSDLALASSYSAVSNTAQEVIIN